MRSTGLEMQYDHPAKNTVRNHWVPFASNEVSPALLKQLSVWFLPGPTALEVPFYKRTGLTERQLVGFEYYSDRIKQIRKNNPGLYLIPRSLDDALSDDPPGFPDPDWANLDFDGSAVSFSKEINQVIGRLRIDRAPRLAISSLGSRDRTALVENMKTFSFWTAASPRLSQVYFDILRTGNEQQGLILNEPGATYMLCRELATSLLVLRAFGERVYGDHDRVAAHEFAKRFAAYEKVVNTELETKIHKRLGQPVALPLTSLVGFNDLLATRKIPISLVERLRFVYRSAKEKWRWTWYYRFSNKEPVFLSSWVNQLFHHHPPLHVVDFTGVVVGNRFSGVCPWCIEAKGVTHVS